MALARLPFGGETWRRWRLWRRRQGVAVAAQQRTATQHRPLSHANSLSLTCELDGSGHGSSSDGDRCVNGGDKLLLGELDGDSYSGGIFPLSIASSPVHLSLSLNWPIRR
ncbi:hypothetical protein AAHE18_08G237400 [Arachis hypogaea]